MGRLEEQTYIAFEAWMARHSSPECKGLNQHTRRILHDLRSDPGLLQQYTGLPMTRLWPDIVVKTQFQEHHSLTARLLAAVRFLPEGDPIYAFVYANPNPHHPHKAAMLRRFSRVVLDRFGLMPDVLMIRYKRCSRGLRIDYYPESLFKGNLRAHDDFTPKFWYEKVGAV